MVPFLGGLFTREKTSIMGSTMRNTSERVNHGYMTHTFLMYCYKLPTMRITDKLFTMR